VAARKILAATWRAFVLLVLVGLGWSCWALGDAASGVASAPAFGAPLLALTTYALERLGAPLATAPTATLACALTGGLGYGLLAFHLRRQRRRLPQPDVVLEERTRLDA
jgi:hypothetical protein